MRKIYGKLLFEYFNEFSKLINNVDHNNLREVA